MGLSKFVWWWTLLFLVAGCQARRLKQVRANNQLILLNFAESLSNFQTIVRNNRFKGWSANSSDPCSGEIQVERGLAKECDPENGVYRSADKNPWTGISCNSAGEVICIQLENLGLEGPTSSLSNLQGLQSLAFLDLERNKLSGPLPPNLGSNLSSLVFIHLEDNTINSTLPDSWGSQNSFSSLQELYLDGNSLHGPLPPSWGDAGNWPKLEYIGLSKNSLTGEVPERYDRASGSFPALETAVLAPGNYFCGNNVPDFPAVKLSQEYISGPEYTNITKFNATCETVDGIVHTDTSLYSDDDLSQAAVAGIITGEVVLGLVLLVVAGIFHRRKRWRQERSWVLFDWDVVQEPKTTKHFNFGHRFPWMHRSGSDRSFVENGSKRLSFNQNGSGNLHGLGSNGAQIDGQDGVELNGGSRKLIIPLQAWRDIMFEPHEIRLQQNADGSLKSLGNGSFGKVYKGVLQEVHECAVKVFEGYTGQQERELLLSEISILRSCRANNVVQFFGVALQKDDIWMVMELMQGNLYRHLARGHHCTWYFRGRSIALDVARGMHYLHSRSIIHMDLKSPNILIGDTGIAKIADVGLARVMGSESFVSQVCAGTMHWMAPEVLVQGRCTEKADIFSFGVILWEICTGEAPSRGRMSCVKVPDECPQDLADLIENCMEEDPGKRPTAMEIINRLQAIPISSRPVPDPPWYAR